SHRITAIVCPRLATRGEGEGEESTLTLGLRHLTLTLSPPRTARRGQPCNLNRRLSPALDSWGSFSPYPPRRGRRGEGNRATCSADFSPAPIRGDPSALSLSLRWCSGGPLGMTSSCARRPGSWRRRPRRLGLVGARRGD